ncbi:hypothetical protein [Nocardia gamkensis]|uniref:hypothetical protein n=1 Tax=Nocardia gamkensis TaxID=352869 RepID=UPI0037C87B14
MLCAPYAVGSDICFAEQYVNSARPMRQVMFFELPIRQLRIPEKRIEPGRYSSSGIRLAEAGFFSNQQVSRADAATIRG